ncbi:unnamed protein product [Camellia sinensis]
MLRVSDSPPRLVKIAEDDNEKFLLKLKKRIDRVGIDLPTIEVRFEHLNVDAEAYVGGRALSTILNFSINLFEKPLSILHDVSGIIKPGSFESSFVHFLPPRPPPPPSIFHQIHH